MISNGKVVPKKREPPIGTSRPPLLNLTRYLLQRAEKRDKHIPVQGIANEPDVGIPVHLQEPDRIECGQIAGRGLPPPLAQVAGAGLAAGDAVPPLEYLLAGAVVPGRRFEARVVDPGPHGVIAGPPPTAAGGGGPGRRMPLHLEGLVGGGGGGRGGGSAEEGEGE